MACISIDPCVGYECSPGEQCKLDDWRRPTCVCRTLCSYDYKPVCANDGRTYSNECVMNAEACKNRVQLHVAHSGECTTASAGACRIILYHIEHFLLPTLHAKDHGCITEFRVK